MSRDASVTDFGTNEWLVDEMYQRFQRDPNSVDEAWHDFFVDYRPNGDAGPEGTAVEGAGDDEHSPPASTPRQAPTSNGHANGAAPAQPAAPAAAPAPAPAATTKTSGTTEQTPRKPAVPDTAEATGPARTPLRGAAARVVSNMEASLTIPTATSVRAVPAKLLIDNRIVINNHLARGRGGKVSFTHLIGYAMVRALADHPEMNCSFAEVDGKPTLVTPDQVTLGLAIDLAKPGGGRSLVVAGIKRADRMDFAQFWSSYEDLIRRARTNALGVDDFAGVTASLTNPGGLGTVHSMPRLMPGQGMILGVGAMEYPAQFAGVSAEALVASAVSKTVTLTSTYDHRVIQGAQSGEFLRRMHQLLLGEDGFYDDVFAALRIPYEPIRWVRDVTTSEYGEVDKQARVVELIHSYRVRGHLMADTDPLAAELRSHPDLDILRHGLTLWDLDREFPVGDPAMSGLAPGSGERRMTLREILGVLRDAYCRTVGVEYMHIQDPEQRRWIQERVETKHGKPPQSEQKHILGRLNAAEAFETFLQTKYVGQKRFSLEGAESTIPLLDTVLSAAAREGLDEVVVGMAHRGRLNVLANIVGKSYGQIFREFDGNIDPRTVHGSGDVKYHLGDTGRFRTHERDAEIAVTLASNPSHLEAVSPVAEGIARAKQDLINKGEVGFTVLSLQVHGDAAFAGQGVVAETLNLSQLRGYRTGGTVHVIVNNQLGFTTGPQAARSSVYSSDVARMVQAPIFHVNGDDPEACVRVARLAFDYRQAFRRDVVIDMICYRRRGHNEADDPSMTQPMMYDAIDARRSVRKLYTEALVGRGDLTLTDAEAALKDYQSQLERAFDDTRDAGGRTQTEQALAPKQERAVCTTAVDHTVLDRVSAAHSEWPENFTVHKRLVKLLDRRSRMASDGNIDWAMGELYAFGSLLLEGRPVRLAGQDSRRGTFVQRQAILVDRKTGEEYTPLRNLDPGQAPFWLYDSLLSEYAAMGFEYGYSVANPDALVLWEAQFGDFANGAQSVIDEFIASGEAKWGQRSGVVLLLPHGHEGQGPDHSSARIERFLTLSAEENMTVAVPSTPANYFHLLRRQVLADVRRPLIVFTPKAMLRMRAATSTVEDFTGGTFAPVLDDPGTEGVRPDPQRVRRVLLCSGRVGYDLLAARAEQGRDDVAVVRLEQLYPLPETAVTAVLSRYPSVEDAVWVQDEPANQGAWPFLALNLADRMPAGLRLRRVSRNASASPAAGSHSVHEREQQALIEQAFRG